MLDIIVCIKQVPDTDRVRINKKDGTLVRDSVVNIVNPDDLHAMEMARTLRDRYGGTITALTMGPEHAGDVLLDAYAFGADRSVHLCDERFAGSDAVTTGKIIARAIEKQKNFSIIITGVEAIDGNTASVSHLLSEFLQIPHITQIHDVEVDGDCVIIERQYGHEFQKVEARLPVLLAVNRETNKVRSPSLASINEAFEKKIEVMTMSDIGGHESEYGLEGSPTVVIHYESFKHKRENQFLKGTIDEKVEQLVHRLQKHNILRY